ncbi:hypothetical protein Misp01_46630 [Microtetraspora sp. NBRC 13810]|nr:hypothetical protein Misp01_46630 [Microtetraspora sp. NBRC 13810]
MVAGCGILPVGQAGSAPPSSAPAATAPAASAPAATGTPAATAAGDADTRPALATTHSSLSPAYQIDLVGLNRVAGRYLVIQLRLSNTGTEDISWVSDLRDNMREARPFRWVSGIGVLDAAAGRWLLPYQPSDADCLCTDERRDGLGHFLDAGESITVFAVVPAPSGNPATTTVVTPAAPPMIDVPISDDPVTPPPGQIVPDPAAQPVTEISHPLLAPSEALDGTEETSDDGTDVHVNLSSDVLFAVNEAKLTSRAKSLLARTAKQIDDSPAGTVAVEGHADSSGTDAINNPLSLRRAEAVRDALTKLLTRSEVRFTVKGYGSRRPLYSNEEEEGRRRNRRVTVTFAKPEPPAPAPSVQSPAAQSSGPPPAGQGLTARANDDGQPFALEVTGLRRLPGDLGVLTYTVTNAGDEAAWNHELHQSAEWLSYKYQAASNVRLTDEAAGRQYLPGRIMVTAGDDTDAYCACSDLSGVRLSASKFDPGETKGFWTLFALPPAGSTVQVKIAQYPPLQVPVP